MSAQPIQLELPYGLNSMFDRPARYRVAYGGRGSTKSWASARMAVVLAYQKKRRILCARELQNSIKDSVIKLLADQIRILKLPGFEIGDNYIKHVNGSEFIFRGLRTNAAEIKSMEGINIAWVEEAQKVSEESWELLIPTIREPESEIWVTFNPEYESDATSQRFIEKPPPDSIVRKINYDDNPWLPEVLRKEMEYHKLVNPKKFKNVWQGEYRDPNEGGVVCWAFSDANLDEGVVYDPTKRLYLSCDFNVDPMCWVVAHIVMVHGKKKLVREYRIIDEIALENSNIRQAATVFADRYKSHKAGIIITGDANSGRARSDVSDEVSKIRWAHLEQGLSDAGVTNFARDVNPSNPRIKARAEVFNELLCNQDFFRRIKIHPYKCPKLVYALKNVKYIPGTDEVFIPTTKMIEDNPENKWLRDDFVDAASYLTWKYDPDVTDYKRQTPQFTSARFTP